MGVVNPEIIEKRYIPEKLKASVNCAWGQMRKNYFRNIGKDFLSRLSRVLATIYPY